MSNKKKHILDLDSDSSSYPSSSSSSSSSTEDEGHSSSDNMNNDNQLTINSAYAKEYERRKRKQELANERQSNVMNDDDNDNDEEEDDYSSSTSEESEDEDGELLTAKVDLQILKTINAIRKKDDSIYNQEMKFFSDQDDDNDSDSDGNVEMIKKEKKQKPKLYKDMVREEILKKMEGDDGDINDSNDDEDVSKRDRDNVHDKRNNVSRLAYNEEQVALRSAFLSSDGHQNDDDNDDDDNENNSGGLFQKQGKDGQPNDDDEIEKYRLDEIAKLTATTNELNQDDITNTSIVDPKGEIDDGEKFLFDFIKNKKWVDHDTFHHTHDTDSDGEDHNDDGKDKTSRETEDGHESDASLNELNKTDHFESRYNFRFEEANNDEQTASGAGLSVVGYARSSLADTVRRKDETRKLKRQKRKERKLAERKAKEERLKRLKNAKKEELEERITQIKSILNDKTPEISNGVVDEEIVAKLMDGDFDSDKFEELMSKMYNDDFYEKEDSEWKTDSDVKESLRMSNLKDDKDVVTGMDDIEDNYNNDSYEDTLEVDKERYDGNEGYDNDAVAYDGYQEHEDEMDKSDDTGGKVLEKKLKEHMMDELYKLDYEDLIGDMPTRFKYRKVQANRYGLRPEEILFSRDTTLKQFVSLNKMAPYNECGEYVPGTKRRKRFREMAKADYDELLQDEKDAFDQKVKPNDNFSPNIQMDQNHKKKRRRQKKVKDNSASKEEKQEITRKKGNHEVEQRNTSSARALPEISNNNDSKNGRKKKGKKVKKKHTDSNGKRVQKDKNQQLMSESRLASYKF